MEITVNHDTIYVHRRHSTITKTELIDYQDGRVARRTPLSRFIANDPLEPNDHETIVGRAKSDAELCWLTTYPKSVIWRTGENKTDILTTQEFIRKENGERLNEMEMRAYLEKLKPKSRAR